MIIWEIVVYFKVEGEVREIVAYFCPPVTHEGGREHAFRLVEVCSVLLCIPT